MLELCTTCEERNKYEILLQANNIAGKVLSTHSSALQRLKEQSPELIESYERIMQSILKELQVIGKARAKNSDPLLMKVEESAYNVLDSLKDSMKLVNFIGSLVRSLSYQDMTDAMRRKSLVLISHVVSVELSEADAMDASFHQCVQEAVAALVTLVQDDDHQTDICRQMALETLSAFIQRFGAHYKDTFLQAVPPTVELADNAELPGVRGMALVCVSSFVNSMGNDVIPMIPCMIASVTTALSMLGVTKKSEAEIAAALTALKALSEHLASFLAPKLPEILGSLLHENLCMEIQANSLQALAHACRVSIASSVPARLIVGPLSALLDTVESKEDKQEHSRLYLMNLLASVVDNMDSTSVATYCSPVFSMVLRTLDSRRTRSGPSSMDIQSVESSAVHCMVQLVLKLNETKFKPMFYRLLEWAVRPPPGEEESSLARKIAFFNVINTLTENLKSVFTPYYSALVEPILDALSYANEDEDETAVRTLQVLTMRSLTRCFMYDTSEFLSEAVFDKILDPIIHLMSGKTSIRHKTKPISELESIEDVDTLINNTVAASCPEWMQKELGTFATTIVACLSQMTMASGMNNGEARWRPLHHAVLMATRSENADSRCTALETIMAICNTLQEEYLVLVPEALPFLSELLEDEDARVEKRTVEVINAMSEKSGEDLKQYLTSG
jgi:U3 small nucleolar RNA-associated protein 10